MEYVRIDTLSLDADLIEKQISRPFARKHRMIPLSLQNGKLRVALGNPFDLEALDSYRRIAGRELLVVVAAEPEILKALNEFYGLRHSVKRAERDLSSGIDLGNLEQLVRMKSRLRDRVFRPAHRQRRRVPAPARLRHAGERHSHRAQARHQHHPLPHRRRAARHPGDAQGRPPGGRLAHQDRRPPRHRREAPARRTAA
jgi:hypothetical protein